MIYLISPDERHMLRNAGDRMPLGVLYLSAALTANNIENKVIDLNHEKWPDVINEIKTRKPEFVGLSSLSPTFKQMKRLALEIKGSSPNTKIIFGGFHATHRPEDLDGLADVVIRGYGEKAIVGAVCKDFEGISSGFDINEYPIPDRTKLDASRYKMQLEGIWAATMITSRGCPWNCGFCSNFDKTQKTRDICNIVKEIAILKNMGYKGIYLQDDSFTLDRDHMTRVALAMKEYDMIYRIETRANLIDEGVARLLGRTGCVVAGIGIESGDDEILKRTTKGTDTNTIRKAVFNLHRFGIKTKGFFIIGLPGETYESANKTIRFAQELKEIGLAYADFYPLQCFPGSPIAENPSKYGIKILDKNYNHYLCGSRNKPKATCKTTFLKAKEIEYLITKARRSWNGSS